MNRLDGRGGGRGEGNAPAAPRMDNEMLEGVLKGIVRLFVQGSLRYREREARVEAWGAPARARRLREARTAGEERRVAAEGARREEPGTVAGEPVEAK